MRGGLTRGPMLAGIAGFLSLAVVATATQPRPEHPRPDRKRAEWFNLNGDWEFGETDESADARFLSDAPYPDRIVVPFCRESKLSGLARTGFVKNVWYRRTFALPEGWKSPRTILHIGACDWRTRVWLNGAPLGEHVGGNVQIDLEITDHLRAGDNTLVVHAFDDARSGLQPLGKQSNREKSYSIFYTRTTGIWQTVWLEGVGEERVADFALRADPETATLHVDAEVDGRDGLDGHDGLVLKVVARSAGQVVGSAERPVSWRDNPLSIPLSEKRLWSTEDPYLYELELTLERAGAEGGAREVVDRVESYFGLRTVEIRGGAILLNGKPVFQRLVLDQGFYPDGVWTAPEDGDLRYDIELSRSVGFNGARLHQKVFEPRFLHWADRLGYLVWGEFPSYGAHYGKPEVNLPILEEWARIVRRDRNHPSLIGWCPFNETPRDAGALQRAAVDLTRAIDPTRPVIESSGWTHTMPHPEVLDAHDYDQNPASFDARWRGRAFDVRLPARYGDDFGGVPFMMSEYGGIGWFPEEVAKESWGYGNNPKTLDEFYARYEGLTAALLGNRNFFGFCYTQLTDIEQEKNGVFAYDRGGKFDRDKLFEVNSRRAAYEDDPPLGHSPVGGRWTLLAASGVDAIAAGDGPARAWRYSFASDDAVPAGWETPDFDDAAWSEGRPGFGPLDRRGPFRGTDWKDQEDLRVRIRFDAPAPGNETEAAKIERLILALHRDADLSIWLNGEPVATIPGFNGGFEARELEGGASKLREGENVLAIHAHHNGGGRYLDLAVLGFSR